MAESEFPLSLFPSRQPFGGPVDANHDIVTPAGPSNRGCHGCGLPGHGSNRRHVHMIQVSIDIDLVICVAIHAFADDPPDLGGMLISSMLAFFAFTFGPSDSSLSSLSLSPIALSMSLAFVCALFSL